MVKAREYQFYQLQRILLVVRRRTYIVILLKIVVIKTFEFFEIFAVNFIYNSLLASLRSFFNHVINLVIFHNIKANTDRSLSPHNETISLENQVIYRTTVQRNFVKFRKYLGQFFLFLIRTKQGPCRRFLPLSFSEHFFYRAPVSDCVHL